MTKIQRLRTVFWNTLRVSVFYLLMMWWGFQMDPMMSELYLISPFIVFSCVAFFLFLFLCRETGCFIFMDKGRLKAILRNGEIEPTASQYVLRFFSWPFLKRACLFFGLFVSEFYLRLLSVKLFLIVIQETLSFWEKITNVSEGLLYVAMILTAYAIMELPAWLLFYKLSFKGHSNRSYEYRFGMKLSLLTIFIIVLRFLSLYLTEEASPAVEAGVFVLFVASSFGLWYLMYRKKCCCCAAGGCPICKAIKSLFRKKEKPETEQPLQKPVEKTEEPEKKTAEPEENPEALENEPEKQEEAPAEAPATENE